MYLRKERFPNLRKSKLNPRGDDPVQIIKKINNNTYQLDLLAKYGVHPTFNISDLFPFVGTCDGEDDHQDLRANPVQGGGDDLTPKSPSSSASTSPSPHQGPITRSMMRKIHMCLSQDGKSIMGFLHYSHGLKKSLKYGLMHEGSSLDLNWAII